MRYFKLNFFPKVHKTVKKNAAFLLKKRRCKDVNLILFVV